jgi:hypothetical protein
MNDAWTQRLAELLAGRHTTTGDELDAGAQLAVVESDGAIAFLAPLARHCRLDETDQQLVWVRPIVGGYLEHGAPYFNLNMARRRGLTFTDAELDGDGIVFELQNDQTARIQPAADETLTELQRWDTFFYTTLTDQEANDLARLDADSWNGRFA